MKSFLFLITASFFSLAAHADYGLIQCESKSKDQSVQLNLDETSDVKVQTSRLSVNGKSASISRVNVTQTDFGILEIRVQVGNGPGKYIYAFQNLGSSRCFGVYGSNQRGYAYVDVINSLGNVGQFRCHCEQD